MDGVNIYTDPLINTWPPFYALLCVPIAILDNFNPNLTRFIWLVCTVLAMVHIARLAALMFLNRKLTFPFFTSGKSQDETINITHWLILVPILITFRFLLDNLSNIQINVFMLLLSTMSIYSFSKGKNGWAGLFLAFGILIKIYPVFLLLYFVVKREWMVVMNAILLCFLFATLPFLIFGIEQTVEYYGFWYEHNVVPFASVAHKNQSFFSMMRSLLMHESPGLNQPLNKEIYVNILDVSLKTTKLISYSILSMTAAVVIYFFRQKLTDKSNLKACLEYVFILTIIPILSPLAWKAYFVFLFPFDFDANDSFNSFPISIS